MLMNTDVNQGSAKIYQFPAGGREALSGRHHEEIKPTTDHGGPQAEACSGSWYHENAIEESNPTWRR
jgi:Protein of unknown function (DUF2735)